MKISILAACFLSVSLATVGASAATDYLGTYGVVSGSCSYNGNPSTPSTGTVAFSLETSSNGRNLKQIDDANGLKGYMSSYIDNGESSFGAGKFSVDETPAHFLVLAKQHIGNKNRADVTESFEFVPNGNSVRVIVTRSFISNYSYSGTKRLHL